MVHDNLDSTELDDESKTEKESSDNDFGPNNADLPERYKNALLGLITKLVNGERYPRMLEVIRSREARFYWDNHQHFIYKNGSPGFMGNGLSADFGRIEEEDTDAYTINIFQQYGRNVVAALSQDAPKVKFQPVDPKNPRDTRTAELGEMIKLLYERNNNVQGLIEEAGYYMWCDGRTSFYTAFETDDELHQRITDEDIDGDDDSEEENATGHEVTRVYGVLEVKVPLMTKSQKNYPWLQLCEEIKLSEAKALYPEHADEITSAGGAPGDESFDREARIAVMQNTPVLTSGSAGAIQMVTRSKSWLQPSCFMELEDKDLAHELLGIFPDGALVEAAGKAYCGSKNESLQDHWVVTQAMVGSGQTRSSLGQSTLQIQDMVNDLAGIVMTTFRLGVPSTFCDDNLVDVQAIRDQLALPGNYYGLNTEGTQYETTGISAAFYTQPALELSSEIMPFLEQLVGPVSQNMTGVQPSLFGAPDESNETASGIAQLRAQSLAQLGPAWRRLCDSYAKIISQVVGCAAQRKSDILDQLDIDGVPQTIEIELDDLRGNIHCFPDKTQGLPETLDQKATRFQQLMEVSVSIPAFQQLLADPNNMALFKDLNGMDEFTVPDQISRDKQLEEISEMLKVGPVPNAQNQATLQNVQKQAQMAGHTQPLPNVPDTTLWSSSVPVDPEVDNHQVEMTSCLDWLNGSEGRATKKTNPDGYKNVRLHMLEHKAQAQQEAQQAQQTALTAQSQLEQMKHPPKELKPPTKSIKSNTLTGASEVEVKDLPVTPPVQQPVAQ